MPETREAGRGVDDSFRRIFDHLKAILDEIDGIRRTHIMIMSGSELIVLANVEGDERDLERDLHTLERRLEAHGE